MGEPISTSVVKHKPLGGLIGAFKTVSTKKVNLLRMTEGAENPAKPSTLK
jgi:hypothetical protein